MRQIKRPNRPPTLLEVHKAHLRNYGTHLTLAEEEHPENVDRVLAWRNSATPPRISASLENEPKSEED